MSITGAEIAKGVALSLDWQEQAALIAVGWES
jgi:hypothetical protein